MTKKVKSKKTAPKKMEQGAVVAMPKSLTVKQLADMVGVTPIDAIKRLMKRGIMATVNQPIDYDTAAAVVAELGFQPEPEQETAGTVSMRETRVTKKEARGLKPRSPVVTILGHVDHGKTSLLDAIRLSNVVANEAGEITQHIGAYQVMVNNQNITFIDTPGHEAFTAMRARGASITDIAVLVVAADDGIMPQTVEAIHHIQAAEVPIVVAINKIDKPNADIDRVKQQLTEHNLVIEEWGGDVIAVPVSAKIGEGIQELLENIVVVAEIAEFKANPKVSAEGVIVESKLDSTKGTLATLLVQSGTLTIGSIIVVENAQWGKIKAMFDDNGNRIKTAGPSVPVEVLGLSEVAQAGDRFRVVNDERKARAIVSDYKAQQKVHRVKSPTLDDVSSQIRSGEAKGLNLIIKTDMQGSISPIQGSLEQLEMEEVKVRIIHAGSGSITESDIMLAVASGAVIIGFNVRPDARILRLAESEGVEIRTYGIIYKLIEDVEKTLKGMLEPTYAEVVDGHAEVRALFKVRAGKIAGCYIIDGKAAKKDTARVMRDEAMVHEAPVSSLKHFKDNVNEMVAGNECGVGVEGFSDFAVGDIIEFYHLEKQ